MAKFEAKVYRLEIEEHPNADTIELVKVGDYRSIVRKGQFKTGDIGVYIPEAAIVPDWLIAELGLEGKLAGKDKNRVKAIKLRGCLSQGLIVPIIEEIDAYRLNNENTYMEIYIGEDVTEFLGIVKYEPPIPTSMSGEVFNAFGKTLHFDIENIKKYPRIFEDGEEVIFTEKLHGTWCCFGYHPESDIPIVTSKGLSEKGLAFKFNEVNEKRNLYVRMFNQLTDKDHVTILEEFIEASDYADWQGWIDCGNKPFYILGEIFGAGVQDLTYGNLPTEFRVFDIYVGEPGEGLYLNPERVIDICRDMKLATVPVLYKGAFNKEVLTEFTNGTETVSGTNAHMREGIVVRPVTERRHDEIGRVILKSVSEKYLLRKGKATEYQ